MAAGCRVVFNHIPKLVGAAPKVMDKAIRAVAVALKEEASNNIQQVGAIDTGAMKNSLYVETSLGSERQRAIGAAIAAGASGSKKGKGKGKPRKVPIASNVPIQKGEAKVALAVEYAIYVELGTHRMGARPFLSPAVESIKAGPMETIAGRVVEDELKKLA